jgi:hypothetical protein
MHETDCRYETASGVRNCEDFLMGLHHFMSSDIGLQNLMASRFRELGACENQEVKEFFSTDV